MAAIGVADWIIIAIIAVSTLLSIKRGFVKEALSLVTLVAAMIISRLFGGEVSTLLVNYIEVSSIRYVVAYAGLFFTTLIIGGLINSLLSEVIRMAGLGGIDRLFGMVFGFARGVLILVLVFSVAARIGLAENAWWQESRLVGEFVTLGDWLHMIGRENADRIMEQVQQIDGLAG